MIVGHFRTFTVHIFLFWESLPQAVLDILKYTHKPIGVIILINKWKQNVLIFIIFSLGETSIIFTLLGMITLYDFYIYVKITLNCSCLNARKWFVNNLTVINFNFSVFICVYVRFIYYFKHFQSPPEALWSHTLYLTCKIGLDGVDIH